MTDDMSAYRDVFLAESGEYLDAITEGLLALETQPNDLGPVEVVFRGAHSLKGMAGAMGYERTGELTHRMESVMDTVRHRQQAADPTLVDLMLRSVDAVRSLIALESGDGGDADVDDLLAALEARAQVGSSAAPGSGSREGPERASRPGARTGHVAAGLPVVEVGVRLEDTCTLKSVRSYLVLKRLGMLGSVISTAPDASALEEERFGTEFTVQVSTALSPEEVAAAVLGIAEVVAAEAHAIPEEPAPTPAGPAQRETPRTRADTEVAPKAGAGRAARSRTVRVPIARMDGLLDLVGELVILRSRLDRTAEQLGVPELDEHASALGSLTGELRHRVMQTRAVPVETVFNRFPRMVRDLARALGKRITFSMSGLEIEVDRTVVDELADPLVHMLRNAVDHGIEPEADRVAAGKPPEGRVTLEAHGEAERVRIIVSDDGRGMETEAIWRSACEAGLVDPQARDGYTDSDVLWLTCLPGLSTARTTTDVSGRGVGMDVVKDRIERLGGSMIMRSTPGQGTSVELVLPLTLAIMQGLLVVVHGRTHILPLASVTEVLASADVRLKTVEGAPVVVVRDTLVAPVCRLDVLLEGCIAPKPVLRPDERIVLVETAGGLRALVADRLIGRKEVVIKPLSPYFKGVRGLAGTTVLGDGSVALILDVRTLCERGA